MNEELSKILGGLMSNPDALKNIMGSLSSPPPQVQEEKAETFPDISRSFSMGDDRRIGLLTALKPYLSGNRGANVDKAIQLIRLAKMTEAMRNEGK